jgi:hypothetical protein
MGHSIKYEHEKYGRTRHPEPLCETSEPGEKLFDAKTSESIRIGIGWRFLEIFDFATMREIGFRMKTNSAHIRAIVEGRESPPAEMLVKIYEKGISLDWLFTARGPKHRADQAISTDMIFGPITEKPPAALRLVSKAPDKIDDIRKAS